MEEKMQITYSHKINGSYADTIAMINGNNFEINTQYETVLPLGDHASDCDQINKMGGQCTCGKLDGIDTKLLILDARKNGKFGPKPREKTNHESNKISANHTCPYCGTYCFGDCKAD